MFIIASARILGPEDFGIYALATVMVSIVFIVFESGIDVNTLKRLAIGTDDPTGLVNHGVYSKLVVFLSCGLLAWTGSWFISDEKAGIIQLAIPVVSMQLGIVFIRHLYRGFVWFDLEARSIISERGITIVFGSLSLWLFGDVTSYLVAFIAAYIVITMLDWQRFRTRSGHVLSFPGLRAIVSHIRSSMTIGVYNAFGMLFTRISTVVMHFGGQPTADIGRFNSGIRLFDSFALIPTIISDPLYPRICAAINDRDALTSIIRFPTIFLFTVTIMASSLLLLHHGHLIGWVLGDAYRVASFEIALVFSTIVVFSVNTITTKLIIASEQESVMSRILGALLVSQIGFLIIAATRFGLLEIVLVYVAHELAYNLILAGVAFRHLHIRPLVKDLGLVVGAASLAAFVAARLPIDEPLITMPLQAAIMGGILIATGLYRWDHVTRLSNQIRSWIAR